MLLEELALVMLISCTSYGHNHNHNNNYDEDIIGFSPHILREPEIVDVDLSNVQLSVNVWANARKSPLKPRKRDLHEPKLIQLLGRDYDHRWMRKTKEKPFNNVIVEEPERKAVRALRALVDNNIVNSNNNNDNNTTTIKQEDQLQLPEDLPAIYRELVKSWLVRRATCPIRFTWDDLGPYFWPRYIKKGECVGNMTCSWPPGMTCVPSSSKILNILRWHCRLRKSMMRKEKRRKNNEKKELTELMNNNTTSYKTGNTTMIKKNNNKNGNKNNKKRKKYRCMWIKVPYPVPEDCMCSCKLIIN